MSGGAGRIVRLVAIAYLPVVLAGAIGSYLSQCSLTDHYWPAEKLRGGLDDSILFDKVVRRLEAVRSLG